MKAFRAVLAALLVACYALPAQADVPNLQVTSALAATGSVAVSNLSGHGTCVTTLPSTGSPVGTVTFEVTADNGTTWTAVPSTSIAGGALATTTAAAGLFLSNVSGQTGFRARVSAYTSGTFNLTVNCGAASGYAPNATQTVSCAAAANCPVNAAQNSAGAVTLYQCDKSVNVNVSGANTQVIAFSGSTRTIICAFVLFSNASTAALGSISYGTGTVCGTGTTALTQYFSSTVGFVTPLGTGVGPLYIVPASNNVCVFVGNAGVTTAGSIIYAQLP